MTDTSQPDQETPVPEGARPVHPDGEVDAPIGMEAADTALGATEPEHTYAGGTTGAEHDGGAEQIAAESQDADAALDGRAPQGADEPLHGTTDGIGGAGAATAGAYAATEGGGVTQGTASPEEGLGSSPTGAGSAFDGGGVEDLPGASPRRSPTEGLGTTASGFGAPVHEADSPTEGLGGSPTGVGGSPVRPASSPEHGTGGPNRTLPGAADPHEDRPDQADPLG